MNNQRRRDKGECRDPKISHQDELPAPLPGHLIRRRDLVCSTREWSSSQTIQEPAQGFPAAPADHQPRPFFTMLPGLSNLTASWVEVGT